MDQEFIKLMQILLGSHGSTIASYGSAIDTHVATLNSGLLLPKSNQFVGNQVCLGSPSSPVVGPVFFSNTYNGIISNEKPNPFVLAVFGLNPKLGSHTFTEKRLAGNNLRSYAAFYNSQSFGPTGVFPLVLNPIVKYYKYLLTVYFSLLYKKFFVWVRFVKRYPDPLCQLNWIKSKLLNYPIIVPEYIPFHSDKSSSISLKSLCATGLNYRDYHEALFDMLKRRLNGTGILLSNGQSATKALESIIGAHLINTNDYFTPTNVLSHQLATWNGRLVIMLNDFLGRAGKGNRFITDDQLKNLLRSILIYCKSNEYELPKYLFNSKECIDHRDKGECQLTDNDDDLFEDLFPDIEGNTLDEQTISYKQNSQTLNETNMSQNGTGKKFTRNRPGTTTESIKKFTKDSKGQFKKGDTVKFRINNGPTIEEGIIMDIKKHLKAAGRGKIGDELAKIKCINTNRKKPECFIFFEEIIKPKP